ncbi:uncharacterized protein AMSG_12323 [Thecamonas trahens ATCC 50062]|uniref:Uncharacterized protein n=1 Tax=Thecamonas trahens ATCC 50062 TaxID=461836 RepID=A0A0L0DQ10_THETB|nr:hypothetical protein AMSG_12323 [Thecamonas trahens ATCC 50062]KNC54394.1 hypothetical protein AMSG_12323 [Thecamonas trahens ATCC 50062]|eukprot:XP_013753740.1 hypothetical protein AMSG_12323 [Thecamonas trahens ATCC 50062]
MIFGVDALIRALKLVGEEVAVVKEGEEIDGDEGNVVGLLGALLREVGVGGVDGDGVGDGDSEVPDLMGLDHAFFLGEIERLVDGAESALSRLRRQGDARSGRMRFGSVWQQDNYETLGDMVAALHSIQAELLEAQPGMDPNELLATLYGYEDMLVMLRTNPTGSGGSGAPRMAEAPLLSAADAEYYAGDEDSCDDAEYYEYYGDDFQAW